MTARHCLICLFALGLSCSTKEQPRAPVWGRVVYRGYPVRGGVVAFTPDKERGTHGSACRANLSSDGSYRVPQGGLSPGWYRITVASLDVGLPGRYRDPDMANLVKEVISGRENHIDIQLDD